MQQLNTNNYEEISLRELIEVLLKGWRLIAVITAICLFFSGIFSFLILEPTYQAKTILMADFNRNRSTSSDTKAIVMTPIESDKLTSLLNNNEDINAVLDSITAYPTMSLQSYKEQLESSKVLQQVIDEMSLDEYDINRSELRKMLELDTIKDTNLITIKVQYSDPKLAADIANKLTDVFAESITEMTKQQALKSSQLLEEQLGVEKKNLDEATLKLKETLSQKRGVNELKQEFDSKLLMLTTFKTQLVEKKIALNRFKAGLSASEKELMSTPQVIVTTKSVGQDPLLNQIVAETNGTSIKDAAQITMENEEINEGYINLKSKVSDYKIAVSELSREIEAIGTEIDTTQKELETLQQELADKEHNQTLVQRNADIAQETYNAFLDKYEEIRIAQSTELGGSTISVVSQAVIPEVPTGPRKMLNLAVAGVIGVMIGVFVVFFKEYWKVSDKMLTEVK